MRRVIFFTLIILNLVAGESGAQIGTSTQDADIFGDITRKYYKDKRYANVEGTPFLFDDWKLGSVILKSGVKYDGWKMNLDLTTSELIVLYKGESEMIAANVKKFDLTNGNAKVVFDSGFPPIEKKTKNTYYNVITEGKASLLKFSQKDIIVRDEFNKKKSFQLYEEYYVFYNDAIVAIRNKNTLTKLFPEKSDQILEFVKENKTKMREETDLKALIKYIDSLLQ